MLNRPPTFFGRIKENCEDFLIGLEDEFNSMFPTTKDEIMDDLRRTRDVAREKYTTAKERFSEELRDIRKDFHDEASDELYELVQQYRHFRQGFRSEEQRQAAEPVIPTDAEIDFQEQIRRYETDLRSFVYVSELNRLVKESLPSSDEIMAYYESRPELATYTIEKELHRMSYTVFTHEGKKLTAPADIEAYYRTTTRNNNNNNSHNNEILWRSANQSLLGDIIVALTSRTGMIRPQLEAATFVTDLTMILDFARDQPTARAECFLNLSIPSLEGERLSMAGVLVVVYFCPDDEKFRARISHVFPSVLLSDEQVNGAARALSH